jgi:two-component system, cell cycle sensor histidine kinase PleC
VSATSEPDLGAVIRVSDTGIGMQPDEIEIALEPWKQVESTHARRYEGTGLGLPLTLLHGPAGWRRRSVWDRESLLS